MLLGLAPALAEPEYLAPGSRSEIRALEIQLQVRISPEETLWYRIHVVEDATSYNQDRSSRPKTAVTQDRSAATTGQTSTVRQIKDGVTVVRTIRTAAVALVRHLLSAATTPSHDLATDSEGH